MNRPQHCEIESSQIRQRRIGLINTLPSDSEGSLEAPNSGGSFYFDIDCKSPHEIHQQYKTSLKKTSENMQSKEDHDVSPHTTILLLKKPSDIPVLLDKMQDAFNQSNTFMFDTYDFATDNESESESLDNESYQSSNMLAEEILNTIQPASSRTESDNEEGESEVEELDDSPAENQYTPEAEIPEGNSLEENSQDIETSESDPSDRVKWRELRNSIRNSVTNILVELPEEPPCIDDLDPDDFIASMKEIRKFMFESTTMNIIESYADGSINDSSSSSLNFNVRSYPYNRYWNATVPNTNDESNNPHDRDDNKNLSGMRLNTIPQEPSFRGDVASELSEADEVDDADWMKESDDGPPPDDSLMNSVSACDAFEDFCKGQAKESFAPWRSVPVTYCTDSDDQEISISTTTTASSNAEKSASTKSSSDDDDNESNSSNSSISTSSFSSLKHHATEPLQNSLTDGQLNNVHSDNVPKNLHYSDKFPRVKSELSDSYHSEDLENDKVVAEYLNELSRDYSSDYTAMMTADPGLVSQDAPVSLDPEYESNNVLIANSEVLAIDDRIPTFLSNADETVDRNPPVLMNPEDDSSEAHISKSELITKDERIPTCLSNADETVDSNSLNNDDSSSDCSSFANEPPVLLSPDYDSNNVLISSSELTTTDDIIPTCLPNADETFERNSPNKDNSSSDFDTFADDLAEALSAIDNLKSDTEYSDYSKPTFLTPVAKIDQRNEDNKQSSKTRNVANHRSPTRFIREESLILKLRDESVDAPPEPDFKFLFACNNDIAPNDETINHTYDDSEVTRTSIMKQKRRLHSPSSTPPRVSIKEMSDNDFLKCMNLPLLQEQQALEAKGVNASISEKSSFPNEKEELADRKVEIDRDLSNSDDGSAVNGIHSADGGNSLLLSKLGTEVLQVSSTVSAFFGKLRTPFDSGVGRPNNSSAMTSVGDRSESIGDESNEVTVLKNAPSSDSTNISDTSSSKDERNQIQLPTLIEDEEHDNYDIDLSKTKSTTQNSAEIHLLSKLSTFFGKFAIPVAVETRNTELIVVGNDSRKQTYEQLIALPEENPASEFSVKPEKLTFMFESSTFFEADDSSIYSDSSRISVKLVARTYPFSRYWEAPIPKEASIEKQANSINNVDHSMSEDSRLADGLNHVLDDDLNSEVASESSATPGLDKSEFMEEMYFRNKSQLVDVLGPLPEDAPVINEGQGREYVFMYESTTFVVDSEDERSTSSTQSVIMIPRTYPFSKYWNAAVNVAESDTIQSESIEPTNFVPISRPFDDIVVSFPEEDSSTVTSVDAVSISLYEAKMTSNESIDKASLYELARDGPGSEIELVLDSGKIEKISMKGRLSVSSKSSLSATSEPTSGHDSINDQDPTSYNAETVSKVTTTRTCSDYSSSASCRRSYIPPSPLRDFKKRMQRVPSQSHSLPNARTKTRMSSSMVQRKVHSDIVFHAKRDKNVFVHANRVNVFPPKDLFVVARVETQKSEYFL